MEYGITQNGFIIKPFEKILEEQKADYKVIFGEDIDLSPDSVIGAYCYNQSIKLSQLWQILGGIYANTDINSATGVYLDRLAQLLDVSRNNATQSTVSVALWGNNGTSVNKGNIVKDVNDRQWVLNANTTITSDNAVGIEIKIKNNSAGENYEFTVNNVLVQYTAVDGDTKETIRDSLISVMNGLFVNTYIFDTKDNDILKFRHGYGIANNKIIIVSENNLEIKKVASIGDYDCEDFGSVYVGAEQVNQIITNVSGLDSVINYVDCMVGKDVEDDDSFRNAIKQRQRNASGNEVAIANAVMKVPEVEYVKVYSNRKITVDAEGRPPKSFEVVVIGGLEQDIAETIFNTAPAGIEAWGNVIKQVTDSEGFIWDIGFSRPTNKYIWIKIGYELNSEEIPNNNIELSLKNNLVQWSNENIEVGTDLIYQKLYTPIYKVKGIKDVDLKIAVSDILVKPDDSEFVQADIIIYQREIALIDNSRIDVSLIGG